MPHRRNEPLSNITEAKGKDWVALTLAIGLCTSINLIVIGVLVNAFYRGINGQPTQLSENATQILVATFGGMIGVIGSYIGYRAGSIDRLTREESDVQKHSIDQLGQPVIDTQEEAPDPNDQAPFIRSDEAP